MKNILYLIQGIFFTANMSIGFDFGDDSGPEPTILPLIFNTMYSGVIKFTSGSKYGMGSLHDHYGYSALTEVKMTEKSLSFKKQYERRNDVIVYKLKKTGDIWVGSYSGKATGTGASRCVTQITNEAFFRPEGLEKILDASVDW